MLQMGPCNLETILNSQLTFKKVKSGKFLNDQSEAQVPLLLVALPGRAPKGLVIVVTCCLFKTILNLRTDEDRP